MQLLENFDDFAKLFHSAHAAISKEGLQPLTSVAPEANLNNLKEVGIPIEHCYYNPDGFIDRYIYWNGPVFVALHSLDLQALKMMRVSEIIKQQESRIENAIQSNNWHRVFSIADKKILFPTFTEYFDRIPDNQKYSVFAELYVRSEFGFDMLSDDLLKRVFQYKQFDPNYNERLQRFKEDAKANMNPDGTINVFHGMSSGNYNPKDEMSWTLQRETAKFFANRFGAKGRVVKRKVKLEQVADYFDSRGEAEVIILPKRLK